MKNKKQRLVFIIIIIVLGNNVQGQVSSIKFPPISLINKLEFYNSENDWDRIGCGFLLKYREDTFAITAKHVLAVAKPDSMKYLSLDGYVKRWTLRPLNNETENVVVDALLNEDKKVTLRSRQIFMDDWLVFTIKENNSNAQPVEFRETPLKKGERLYVVGWTRHMSEGEQRVYEFEYFKTKGTHIYLKNIIVPEKFGGLSGSPVLDENGLLVGIVSNSIFNVLRMKKIFSPCSVENLKQFLETSNISSP